MTIFHARPRVGRQGSPNGVAVFLTSHPLSKQRTEGRELERVSVFHLFS